VDGVIDRRPATRSYSTEQRQLIIILSDISGYTRFMVENRTAALHGQMVISRLIESCRWRSRRPN
jgi:hypothetical protein